MGLISSIRKRLWIVTVLMAMALLGFILMDLKNGNSSKLFNNDNALGSVAGTKIDYKDFQNTERILYQNSEVDYFGRKDYLWNQYVEKAILDKESNSNGLGVSPAEMKELQFGNFLSPVVQRNFRDPNTGQINREQLNQLQQGYENGSLNPQLKEFWDVQEKEIKQDRMYTKLKNIVSKSLYNPDFVLEQNHKDGNTKYEVAYSRIPYTVIKDEEAKLSDEEVKNYLKAHAAKYQSQEETRGIKYIIASIEPTSEDSAAIRKILEVKVPSFTDTKDDSLFIVTNLGKWDDKYSTIYDLPMYIQDSVKKLNKGIVFGPYIDNGEYKLGKIMDKKLLPDSVKSRHILRRVTTQAEYDAAVKLLDSIQAVVKSGKNTFDSLATLFSQDYGSAIKGGDLGYVAKERMVKPFNDLIFYKLGKGEMKVIPTQFGLHLVQVTDQKFISNTMGLHLGIISETIEPGEKISNQKLDELQNLLSENLPLDKLIEKVKDNPSYKIESASLLTKNAYKLTKLGEGNSSVTRDIIRWAFSKEASLNEVSPEVYSLQDEVKKYTNRYVLAGLTAISPKGLYSVETARELLNEKLLQDKKFNMIKTQIGPVVADLNGKYGGYEIRVDTAKDLTVLGANVGSFNNEYAVAANISKAAENQVVGPIQGENGVFIAKIINKAVPPPLTNIEAFKKFYTHPAKNTAMTHLMDALKKNTKIKDNRSKFY